MASKVRNKTVKGRQGANLPWWANLLVLLAAAFVTFAVAIGLLYLLVAYARWRWTYAALVVLLFCAVFLLTLPKIISAVGLGSKPS